VSQSRGSDALGCGNYSMPCKTIQTGINQLGQNNSVTTIEIEEGEYFGVKNINLTFPSIHLPSQSLIRIRGNGKTIIGFYLLFSILSHYLC